MTRNANLTLYQPLPDEEVWTEAADRQYELGLISADEARLASGITVARSIEKPEIPSCSTEEALGTEATSHVVGLELVTEAHAPRSDAHQAAKLRDRPAARTAKAKADRDQGETLRHKTPPEWTPILRRVS